MADKNENGLGKAMAYGLELAVGVALGYFVGIWLDKRFGTTPWGLTIAVLLGLAAGMYPLVKEAMRPDQK